MTRTIKQLEYTNKILTEELRTLAKTNARLTLHRGKQQQRSVKLTMCKNYDTNTVPTGYGFTHSFKVLRVNTRLIYGNRNDVHMEESNRSDTMGGDNKKSGWVSVS